MNLDNLAQQTGDIAEPSDDELRMGRQRLDVAAQRAGARVTAVRRSRRRSGRRWGITALTGVAAATAVALVVPLVSAPAASAEEVLRVTAEAAGQQPDGAVGARYWYVRSEVDYSDTEPFQREIWQGRSEDGVLREQDHEVGSDGIAVDPTRSRTDDLGGPAMFVIGGHPLSWQDLETLPTEPVELEALLRTLVAGHQSGEENELWESVTGLLRESPASPALRQALWEIAAGLPDVELLGPVTDAVGRDGIAIERTPPIRNRYPVIYVVDPETGALLEVRDLAADGTVAWRATQLVQEPSDTAPVPEPPICGPGSVPERSC